MAWLYQPILQATAALGNHSPSVALNTPLDTGSVGPTPTLDFTGTDADTDDIRYRVQIATDNLFTNAPGNIVKNTVGTNRTSGGDPTVSTVVADENCLIAVVTTQDSNTSNLGAGSVTRNGQSFTMIDEFGGSGGAGQPVRIQIWYLLNPDVGTYNTVADCNSSINECTMTVYPLENVDTADLINGYDGDTGNGFAPAMSVTTDADDCYLISGIVSESEITGYDTGQTEDSNFDDQSFENTNCSSEQGTAAGAQAQSFSMASGAPYAQMMIAINKATTGGSLLIDAISGTDLGFVNPDNGGDTDPFTSGENIQYTVQAGDTLADGTYYWRVIAIDPSGSNVYGNWSSIRSFVVTSATSYTITKSLKYTVIKAITAITKSLKYTVKTTPATVTKTLRYFVNKAGTITKSLKYSVVKAITLTKSLKYTVFTNPTALTKSLKYSVLKSLTITKALIYKVQRSASAITKSLKYTVLKSLTVTKSLKYTIVKSATAITKSLKYSVIKATTITKSLTYEVVSATSTTITKSLTYAILKSYSITKSLTYLVRSPATITKSLKYAVIKAITLTKSLKYAVTKPGNITKQLIYKVLTSSTLTKSLSYMVTAGQTIQKSLKYAVVKATTLTKSLTYYVVNNGVIQRTLRYHVISQHTIDLDLSYRIITSGVITKSLRYVVSVPRGYRSALPSSRQTRPLDQVSGQAVDSTNKSTQLQTYQAKTIL